MKIAQILPVLSGKVRQDAITFVVTSVDRSRNSHDPRNFTHDFAHVILDDLVSGSNATFGQQPIEKNDLGNLLQSHMKDYDFEKNRYNTDIPDDYIWTLVGFDPSRDSGDKPWRVGDESPEMLINYIENGGKILLSDPDNRFDPEALRKVEQYYTSIFDAALAWFVGKTFVRIE